MTRLLKYPCAVPKELAGWMNDRLPTDALWEVHPVHASSRPHAQVGWDVVITGDLPPAAARACTLDEACRRALQAYLQYQEAKP